MEKKVAKKRNVAIELWRFLIAFAIIGFHTGWIIARSCNGTNGYFMQTSNWFFGSSEVLLIFTLTTGYFMVSHFKRKNAEKNIKKGVLHQELGNILGVELKVYYLF